MDASVLARETRLVRGIGEGRPGEGDGGRGGDAWFDDRAAGCNRVGIVEGAAARKLLQDMGAGRAEGTVSRNVFRKGWGDDTGLLIRHPLAAIHRYRSLTNAPPGLDLLAGIQKMHGGNRAHRVVEPFALPAGDRRV